MLKATFEQKDRKLILKLKGHAGHGKRGHDLVCASASILAYTVAQFVKEAYEQKDLKSPPEIKLDSGDTVIACEPSDEIIFMMQDVYLFAQMGFLLLAYNYPKCVETTPFSEPCKA